MNLFFFIFAVYFFMEKCSIGNLGKNSNLKNVKSETKGRKREGRESS